MKAVTARVSSRYQIVIPKEVREALDIRPQDTLLFLIDGKTVHMRPRPDSFTQKLRGLHQHVWPDDLDRWLHKERATWEA